MNVKKMAGFLVIIFVLFWILSAPTAASGSVSKIMSNTQSAGHSMVAFMQGILGGNTTSTTRGATTHGGASGSGATTGGAGG